MLHIPQGTAHMRILLCTLKGSRRGPWNSVVLYLSVTIGAQWAVDSAIGTGFYKLLSVFAKLYPPHMPQFYMPTIGNHQNNSKIAPISHYLVPTSTGKALALVASYAIFSAVDTRHRDMGYPVSCCKCKQDSVGVRRILVVPQDSDVASTGFCWCILSNKLKKRSRY